jgi:drug/metabolite transporter (DMT)-like permease
MQVFVFGLLSAFTFALGLVLQQRGTLETTAPEGDPRFLREILRKPIWLLGCLLLLCGWVFQAAALRHGSLALVQSLQALSLVIALPLGVRLTRQRVGRRSVIGACTTLLGIILLVTLGQPQGGTTRPGAAAWWTSAAVVVVLASILVLLARKRRGAVPAALFAAAAGLAFAFQAAVTKTLVAQLDDGLGAVVSNWPLYVFILAELAGFTLQQSALKTGFLAPATAALNAATLAVSVILAVTLFEESVSHGVARLAPALVGLFIAIIGVVVLASSTPPRKQPAATEATVESDRGS